MSRADLQLMQELRNRTMGLLTLPDNRFFTPKPVFWDMLKAFVDGERSLGNRLTFMDCGCGAGDLIKEAQAHDLTIAGCDVQKRERQEAGVLTLDATQIRWRFDYWPLICRPDHSGWAEDVVSNAILQGARAIYVGKPSNYHRDVGGLPIKRFVRNVGEEGETMYITGQQ